jgi:hypothetical protein
MSVWPQNESMTISTLVIQNSSNYYTTMIQMHIKHKPYFSTLMDVWIRNRSNLVILVIYLFLFILLLA